MKIKQGIISKSFLTLIAVSVISKVLGFAREVVIAQKFGVEVDLDVFLVALTIPNMINGVLMYAVPHLIVPRYSKFKEDDDLFGSFSKTFFWPYFVILTIFQICYLLLSPVLVKILAGDLEASHLDLAIKMARYFSIFVYFTSLFCAFKGIFHVKKWFLIPAIAPFFVHLFVILMVIFTSETLGVISIVLGMGIGSLFQFLLMVYHLRIKKALSYFKLGFNLSGHLLVSFMIVVFIEIMGQAYTLIDRSFTAEIPRGLISGLNYANILKMLPISILGISLGTVIFPNFSSYLANNDYNALKQQFRKAISFVLIVGGGSFLVLNIGAEFIVKLLFQRGQFDENATYITKMFLEYASMGIPFIMAHTVFTKLFLSLNFERFLLLFAAISILAKYVMTLVFVNNNWYWGIAASTVIAYLFCDLLMFGYLKLKRIV